MNLFVLPAVVLQIYFFYAIHRSFSCYLCNIQHHLHAIHTQLTQRSVRHIVWENVGARKQKSVQKENLAGWIVTTGRGTF